MSRSKNEFFDFVETYWDDIVAFFEAIINFVKALFATAGEEEQA